MAATSRADRKAETRARILEIARAHFERHGYEDTNLRAIAAEAGIAAGTILVHFEDKRDLLHAALFDDLTATAERAVSTVPRGKLEKQLHHIVATFLAYYERRPALSRVLLQES